MPNKLNPRLKYWTPMRLNSLKETEIPSNSCMILYVGPKRVHYYDKKDCVLSVPSVTELYDNVALAPKFDVCENTLPDNLQPNIGNRTSAKTNL